MNWAIEAAEARRDQWQAHADGEHFEHDVYEETSDGAREIAEGISDGITIMKQAPTESEALVAMMIWEFALHEGGHVRDWLNDGEGAYQARDNTLHIARQWTAASDWAYDNGFDASEDWEFVPRMLLLLAESFDKPTHITKADVQATAEFVVEKWKEEVE
jgi:hypothetical protein